MLRWNVSGLPEATALHWSVVGYANGTRDCPGAPSGTVHWSGPGALLELELSFGRGFFEVSFAEVAQSFGVVSLPLFAARHPEGRDGSFSVDAALTQASGVGYRPDFAAYRSQLIEALGRLGLAAARERGCTGSTMAADGTMSEWPTLNVDVREEWAAAGVGVVDLCYETANITEWSGVEPGASIVKNLSAFALKWHAIAHTYPARRAWTDNRFSFVELFNEVDSDASAGTGDQYMAAAQAVTYGLRGSGVKLLCGVVTDSVHDGWRDAAADNGLLDGVCDGFSFHSYRAPSEEEKLVATFRNWLASRGSPSFSLMVTEAGTQSDDWQSSSGQKCSAAEPQCAGETPGGWFCYNDACVGKMRPQYGEDLIYAWDIVAKAVEHKAVGTQASFAFVLFYYAEATGSFSMTGRDGTALRSLAALAQAISVLSGATYVGDLPNQGWRVFNTTSDGLVAVISQSSMRPTGLNATTANPVWSWYYPVRKLEGIDGRVMNVHCGPSGCQYENEDGLLYAYLGDDAIHVLQRHTVAAQLSALARPQQPPVQQSAAAEPALAFVLRYEWDENQVEILSGTTVGIGSAWGFRARPANTLNLTALSFTVSIHSLCADTSAPAADVVMKLQVGDGAKKNPVRRSSLAPMEASNATWLLDLSEHADGPAAVVRLQVSAEDEAGAALARPLKLAMHLGEWGCSPAGRESVAPKVGSVCV